MKMLYAAIGNLSKFPWSEKSNRINTNWTERPRNRGLANSPILEELNKPRRSNGRPIEEYMGTTTNSYTYKYNIYSYSIFWR